MNNNKCQYSKDCSGCQLWELDYVNQVELKKSHLKNLLIKNNIHFPEIGFVEIAPIHIRDRLDFVLDHGKFGLFSKKLNQTLPISDCLILNPSLNIFYQEFQKLSWPKNIKGSFRLRVNHLHERGCWLDFSNLDIKFLLEEKSLLLNLLKISKVEIGQKRKTLKHLRETETLKLVDPEPFIWSRTWDLKGHSIDLYSYIGSFTQAGDLANQKIIKSLQSLFLSLNLNSKSSFFEYGCGNGNLTFSLLAEVSKAYLLESESSSIINLEKTAKILNLDKKINVVNPKQLKNEFSKIFSDNSLELILANPPRSGLKDFLELYKHFVKSENKPIKNFIYMSCFPESFTRDMIQLKEFGYKIKDLQIIDQFPQTDHYEVMCLLEI